jgi:nucleoside-diphosphate-sugar epimerase
MGKNLITGGSGFFGSYLARQLLGKGEEVVLFQRREQLPPSAKDLEGRVQICSGDISNWVHVLDAVSRHKVDCIYHSAALLTRDLQRSAVVGFRVNIEGTLNVLEAARILGVKDVIYVASGAIYGVNNPPRNVFNDTPPKPQNMYTTTKLCSELIGVQYWRQYGLNFRGIRYAMVVGPTRQITYYYGDWSGIVERTAQGKPYTVHSNPDSPCAYIYIKDAVRALVELKQAPEERLRQRVYNAHGFMGALKEVAGAIKRQIPDAQIKFEWDQGEEMKTSNNGVLYEMDNTVAFEDFGYQTKYPLDLMVADFIKEVRIGRAG